MPRSKSTSKKYSYFEQVSKSDFLKMMETKIQDLKQQKKQLLNSGDIDGAQKLEKKISELTSTVEREEERIKNAKKQAIAKVAECYNKSL